MGDQGLVEAEVVLPGWQLGQERGHVEGLGVGIGRIALNQVEPAPGQAGNEGVQHHPGLVQALATGIWANPCA